MLVNKDAIDFDYSSPDEIRILLGKFLKSGKIFFILYIFNK